METLGILIGIALTLCVFSFLYRDNPFYTFAEHLFVGIAAGYGVVVQIEDGVIGTIWLLFRDALNQGRNFEALIIVVPIFIGVLFFMQFHSTASWLVRIPFALTIAYGAGLAIPATFEQDIFKQVHSTINLNQLQFSLPKMIKTDDNETLNQIKQIDLLNNGETQFFSQTPLGNQIGSQLTTLKTDRKWKLISDDNKYTIKLETNPADREIENLNVYVDFFDRGGWQIFNSLLIIVGVICTLTYFFFSVEHRGMIGGISQAGIIFIMIGFGAAFGNTVMGRVSLLIGRVDFLIKGIPSILGL